MKILILIFLYQFSINTWASDKTDEVCFEEVNEVFKEFQPEFIELQSKLALYKTAWTALILNKANGDDLVTMEKEISQVAKKIEKNMADSASFRDQHRKLLNYRSYVDRWETKQETQLPEAIELLATNVNTDDFYQNVLSNVGDKERVQESIKKYAVDYQTVKATELLHDLYKKDRSRNNYLLKITNQVSSALRGRDAHQARDKAFFESMIEDFEKKLSVKKEDLIKKLKEVCSEEQVLHVINEKVICPNLSPEDQMMTDLSQLMDFSPVLDLLNKDAKVSDLKKEYLRVAPRGNVCEINLSEENLVFDFSSIPKNGDYKIFLPEIGEANSIVAGSLTIEKNTDGKFVIYNEKDKKEYYLSNEEISKIQISDGIESFDCRFTNEKFQGKKWVSTEREKQEKKINNAKPPQEKETKTIVENKDTKYKAVLYSITKPNIKNPIDRDWTNKWRTKEDIQVDTEVSRKFLKTLSQEKKALMELYGLTNDEYNELSKIAFGILGNEYVFGNPAWYRKLKEDVPEAVPVLKSAKKAVKGWWDGVVATVTGDEEARTNANKNYIGGIVESSKHGFAVVSGIGASTLVVDPASKYKVGRAITSSQIDISSNSRGLAQMKTIPEKIKQKYPKISKNTLMNPDHAAIAIMGFLAQSKQQVMNSANLYNKKIKDTSRKGVDKTYKYEPITEKNWTKFVHYVYMGSSRQLTEGLATPEKNQYYRKILYWNQALSVKQLN